MLLFRATSLEFLVCYVTMVNRVFENQRLLQVNFLRYQYWMGWAIY